MKTINCYIIIFGIYLFVYYKKKKKNGSTLFKFTKISIQ